MKKLLFSLLAIIAVLALAGCGYNDASYYQYEENDDGTLTIVGISETYSQKLKIPAEIDGKAVTAIGDFAFYNNDYIRKITLPDSVRAIGECSFADCNELHTVILGADCRAIGLQAFEGCNALTEIELSKKLEIVEDLAFNGCLQLKEFDAPATLSRIGTGAFDHCEQLVIIKDSSPVAAEYADTNKIPTGFADSDEYMYLKLIAGIAGGLIIIGAGGYFLKKRRKKS